MKKAVLYIAVFLLALVQNVYAEKTVTMSTDILFEDDCPLTLSQTSEPVFFSTEVPQLDYSRIDGVLTVEVSDYNELSTLLIGEYSADDVLIDAHIITEVKAENPISVSGEYEKIFLWEFPGLIPQCESISTECEYDIVEGVEGEWEVSDDGHTLQNYIGDATDVVIPNSYRGKRIYYVENVPDITEAQYTKVSDIYHYNIFNSRTDITSLKISEGIKIIGNFAFAQCNKLTGKISLPESVYIIGKYAYYNCSGLTGDLDLSNLNDLYAYAFCNCSGLDGELTLPAMYGIDVAAFANCSGLKGKLVIPDGVAVIEKMAFSCDESGGFTELALPLTLKMIGAAAFQHQSSISNELSLPEGLVYIGDFAFSHCSKISNTVLEIPDSVKIIGGDYGVESNTGYGAHVFYDSFKNVTEFKADGEYFTSEEGVLYSADRTRLVAYPPAKAVTEFIIPEGVTQLDEMSLAYSRITDLTLPDSYVIGEVPENVVNDTANNLAVALYHNNSIQNVWTNETNTAYKSVDGIVYSANGASLWYVPTKKTGTITVADGTERVEKGALYVEYKTGGETYTGIHIPASVNYIAEECIESINLRPLENITIAEENQYYTVVDGKISDNNL